jgi:hypothetical protein
LDYATCCLVACNPRAVLRLFSKYVKEGVLVS